MCCAPPSSTASPSFQQTGEPKCFHNHIILCLLHSPVFLVSFANRVVTRHTGILSTEWPVGAEIAVVDVMLAMFVCSDIEAGSAFQDRLEGMIMRSQVLVLLQNQVFTDGQGRLLSGDMPSQRLEMQLDSQMRSYYRRRYTHRYGLCLCSIRV